MLKLFRKQHRSILGIDISTSHAKILEVSTNGEEQRVESYSCIALPENAMEGNVIKDVDAVANSIKKLLETAQLSCKLAACAIPDSLAISKIIQINDGLSPQEIEELIVSEADKYIPYPIDEINIDFSVQGPSAKNSAMLDVLVAASRAENVSSRIDVINRAGLEAKIVDIESFAVERAARLITTELPDGGAKKIIAVIDIGAVFTHLFVLHGMKVIFSREEEFGAKQLIDDVMQRYKLSKQEALLGIESGGLPADYEDEVVQPFKEHILLQVKRALQFFFSSSQHMFVDYIVLAGGIAIQPGLAALLQDHINIPTSVANPFAKMTIAKSVDQDLLARHAPRLLVACGLALRSSE